MENKEDWEEIEKWAEKDKQEFVEKFGVDFDQIDIEKQSKKMNIFSKIIKGISKSVIYILLAIIILFLVFLTVYAFNEMDNSTIANVERRLEKEWAIRLKEISRDTDEKGNGTYTFTLKKNKNVIFTAIKDGKHLSNDFYAQCHKYFFDTWDSKNKKAFIVEEHFENNLLYFETDIEIEKYDEIDDAVNKAWALIERGEKYLSYSWNISIKKDDFKIPVYQRLPMTKEEAIVAVKKDYLIYLKNNSLIENIPTEEFDKFLKE